MTLEKAESPAARPATIQPSHWLIVLTVALLAGQAAAVLPFQAPFLFAFVPLAPLPLLFSRSWRQLALLVIAALSLFVVGYARHQMLLVPDFPPNHLRSV